MDEIHFSTGSEELDFVVNEFADRAYIKYISTPRLGISLFNDTSKYLSYLFDEFKKTSKGGRLSIDYNIDELIERSCIENLKQQVNQILQKHTDYDRNLEQRTLLVRKSLAKIRLKEDRDYQTPMNKDELTQSKFIKKILELLNKAGLNQVSKDKYLFFDKLSELDTEFKKIHENSSFTEKVKYLKKQKDDTKNTAKQKKFKIFCSYYKKLAADEFRRFLWFLNETKFKKHVFALHALSQFGKLDNQRYKELKKLYFHIYGIDKTAAKQTKYLVFMDMLSLNEELSEYRLKQIFDYIYEKIS